MSPEAKENFKKFGIGAYRGGSIIGLIALIAQSYFDSTSTQIANDVTSIKVMQQHMVKQQDAIAIDIDKLEDRVFNNEKRCLQFDEKNDQKFAALWRAKQNKPENLIP